MGRENFIKPVQLRFGTSGLRGLVESMTDMECYINTRGFIDYLIGIGDIKTGDTSYIAGDLRFSTERIMIAVAKGIEDSGSKAENCGRISSPALAYYAMQKGKASIMITGSHIPEDRNGIKYNKREGEVLKSDEPGILAQVAKIRKEEYAKTEEETIFNEKGMFKKPLSLGPVNSEPRKFYIDRYLQVFSKDSLKGNKIVFYQHSAVGRDIAVEILEGLGAQVIPVGRSDAFIPVDTEAIREEDLKLVKNWADQYHPFAVLSTDGDSDRPWLSDENGRFLRGDMLGVLAAKYLEADSAAVPVSSNDAVDTELKEKLNLTKTKIGSPYVIKAMRDAFDNGFKKVVGWEVNGGFLTQTDFQINEKPLKALPTRDSILPLICALLLAIKEKKTLSQLIDALPERFSQADRIKFPIQMQEFRKMSGKIIDSISPEDKNIDQAYFDDLVTIINKEGEEKVLSKEESLAKELLMKKKHLEQIYFNSRGFKPIVGMIFTDGVRIIFKNNDVIHFRPSGNAPEFRCYSNANSQERADEIVNQGIKEIIAKMEKGFNAVNKFLKNPSFIDIKPQIADYNWGGKGKKAFIPEFIGTTDWNKFAAEAWYGSHPKLPSLIEPLLLPLNEFIGYNDEVARAILGERIFRISAYRRTLPIMFKILDAQKPLSIQAHPWKGLAAILNILDSENYPDANLKIEVQFAIDKEGMTMLNGFKPFEELKKDVPGFEQRYNEVSQRTGGKKDKLLSGYEYLFDLDKFLEVYLRTRELTVSREIREELINQYAEEFNAFMQDKRNKWTFEEAFVLVDFAHALSKPEEERDEIIDKYLNMIYLNEGQCILNPADHPHSDISGKFIEVMSSGDDTIRAGRTTKLVDITALLASLSFNYGKPDVLKAQPTEDAHIERLISIPELFNLQSIRLNKKEKVEGEVKDGFCMLIVMNGSIKAQAQNSAVSTRTRGEATIVPAILKSYSITSLEPETQVMRVFV
uniref:mannose-6-phosphate isomerase n=1 Tax=Candidatus Methanophaga sp. ANME-1 ERB7 TaxID=2759913 RepID=A0A7G9Z5W6_9EURY|nr:phosphoglucosamine mutase [Methanosarcinales archaeon ANME-1 ERB7]